MCDNSYSDNTFRLGITLAQPPLLQILSNTKAPYNISTPTAYLAQQALSAESIFAMQANVRTLVEQRVVLLDLLKTVDGLGSPIGANDANFVMVPVLAKDGSGAPDSTRAQRVYKTLAEEEGVVVRYRGNEMGCPGCLRVTVGTEAENKVVVDKLRKVLATL